ncbi:MAG: hypothetical protein NTX87_04100 [Planctomycetota bacterium]|nr:hypothetical protein [Planctomycetota bacterium]
MKRTLVGLAAAVLAGAVLVGAVLGGAVLAADTRPASGANPDAASAEGVALLVLPIEGEEKGLGDQVRLMLINKAKRLRAVVYDPGSVAEVLGPGDAVTVDTPPEKLAALGCDKFKADLVVAGSVKGKGPYAVRLVAVRTRTGQPLVLDKTYSCAYHQIIPLEMAKAVFEIFSMRIPDDPLRMLREDPQIEQRWRDGPNLVRNPGFEIPNAAGNGPADWQAVEKQMFWAPSPDGPGKVIKYDMDEATAGSYGLDFYSDWIEIQPGATYRFSCRYKSEGPTPKIFLKGYHAFPPQEGFPADRRETYRRQVHPGGEKGQWNSVAADFIPEATRPDQHPTFLKVDLYAYWPKGVIYWDDIVLKKVDDAPAEGPETVSPKK